MTNHSPLTDEEIIRYSRHIMLSGVGMDGQQKLKRSRVLVVGAGGLGSPAAMYLGAAGVGHLGIVDFDTVDPTNLQRQIIHATGNVGRPKAESARERLREINPLIDVEVFDTRLTSANALAIIGRYDLVVDGTDNFSARYLVNDACVMLGKPDVYGSVYKFEGQASVFFAREGACYRCLYPEPPAAGLVHSCAEAGVLGVLPGVIGSIQANEAVKLILGKGESLIGRLLLFDAWAMRFREIAVKKNPSCPMCGSRPSITALTDLDECRIESGIPAAAKEGRTTAGSASGGTDPGGIRGPVSGSPRSITAVELKAMIDRGETVQLIDVREPYEFLIAKIPSSRLIPLGEIVLRKDEIDSSRTTVLICRSGKRSASAIDQLAASGFHGTLLNLEGGILSWAETIDPCMHTY